MPAHNLLLFVVAAEVAVARVPLCVPDSEPNCPTVLTPVCGPDGKKYDNKCRAVAMCVSEDEISYDISTCTVNSKVCARTELAFMTLLSAPSSTACTTDVDCSTVSSGCSLGMSGGCFTAVGTGFNSATAASLTADWSDKNCCDSSPDADKPCAICSCMPPIGTVCKDKKCAIGEPTCTPNTDPICPKSYEPVCGPDKKAYDNKCMAKAMCFTDDELSDISTCPQVQRACDRIESSFMALLTAPSSMACTTDEDCSSVPAGCSLGMSGDCYAAVGAGYDSSTATGLTGMWSSESCCDPTKGGKSCAVCKCATPADSVCKDNVCAFGESIQALCADLEDENWCLKKQKAGRCSASLSIQKKCRKTCMLCGDDTKEPTMAPTAKGTSEACEDTEEYCLKRQEKCSAPYMQKKCRKTCKVCGDDTKEPTMAPTAMGTDDTKEPTMAPTAKGTSEACEDTEELAWCRKRQEKCSAPYMQKKCRKTCKVCGDDTKEPTMAPTAKGTSEACEDTEEYCLKRKEKGQCSAPYMLKKCRKTCELCRGAKPTPGPM